MFLLGSKLFLVDVKSPGGGELTLSACPRGGEKNINWRKNRKSLGVCPGGMVTARIEPCITYTDYASLVEKRPIALDV